MVTPAQGVDFDGANDFMSVAALTGIANGQKGTLSFWFKVIGNDGTYNIIFESQNQIAMELYRDPAGIMSLQFGDTSGNGAYGGV